VLLTEDISAKVAAFEEEEKGTNAPSPSPRGSGAVARKSLNCVYGCFVIDQFARSASISFASTARAYVTNAISQELFIAELTKVEPILKSGEPYWAMTFKRLADGRQIRYVAWPKDPLIQRMRKLSPKQASEDRIERQLSGLRVLFMTEPSAVDVGVHVTNFLFLPDEQVINKTLVLSDDRQSETKP
jgi:hypothetical protein